MAIVVIVVFLVAFVVLLACLENEKKLSANTRSVLTVVASAVDFVAIVAASWIASGIGKRALTLHGCFGSVLGLRWEEKLRSMKGNEFGGSEKGTNCYDERCGTYGRKRETRWSLVHENSSRRRGVVNNEMTGYFFDTWLRLGNLRYLNSSVTDVSVHSQ